MMPLLCLHAALVMVCSEEYASFCIDVYFLLAVSQNGCDRAVQSASSSVNPFYATSVRSLNDEHVNY